MLLDGVTNPKLGRQVLAISLTATNTFSTLLVNEGTSIPAFQNLFNYILLTIVYTSYTLYRYGFKKWLRLIQKDGWKCTSPHPRFPIRSCPLTGA